MRVKDLMRNRYLLAGDIVLAATVVFGSYVLRLEPGPELNLYLPSAYWLAALAVLIKPPIYYAFGLYRRVWLYASIQELKLIAAAVTVASIPVGFAILLLFNAGFFVGFPRSVLIIDWLLSILAVGGLRFALRMLAENKAASTLTAAPAQSRRVLIIGAGDAGALVVRELQKNPQLNMLPVGFLDDDPSKQRQQIYGIPVEGSITDLERVLSSRQVDEVIIAIPSAPGRVVRLVADVCRLRNIPFRIIPGIYELLGGKVSISRLREVTITDLLRREPAHLDESRLGVTLGGRVVLVTGAGGSIGSELCRQIARWAPSELILLGHGENSIFETLLEMQESFPLVVMRPVIANVSEPRRLETIFHRYRPDVVFHAAAHKHVPLMEMNVEEAVLNNVLGAYNIVQAALSAQVERMVMISSDKAVRPVNVMGATKRIAELIVLDGADRSGRAFSVVRFGNVLGSRGSIVPLFKRQIARGGPITITHPDMRRYFMTIPEAVHLVLQSAGMGAGGETYVLNMGEQVRILDLAEDLIRLSGLEPGRDIEIVFTGVRPGDKLSEDLWDEGQEFEATLHPDIQRLLREYELQGYSLETTVNELVRLAREGDTVAIIQLLDEVIPNASVYSRPPPDLQTID
ncbi:MAG TPA: nucleoside-diphosphate sugar epimerase/dehydratase [Levilinea sp.]|nr:nucleoside-diphosphate sugar epimerase/dehydratase [Levilinea sp.]